MEQIHVKKTQKIQKKNKKNNSQLEHVNKQHGCTTVGNGRDAVKRIHFLVVMTPTESAQSCCQDLRECRNCHIIYYLERQTGDNKKGPLQPDWLITRTVII